MFEKAGVVLLIAVSEVANQSLHQFIDSGAAEGGWEGWTEVEV